MDNQLFSPLAHAARDLLEAATELTRQAAHNRHGSVPAPMPLATQRSLPVLPMQHDLRPRLPWESQGRGQSTSSSSNDMPLEVHLQSQGKTLIEEQQQHLPALPEPQWEPPPRGEDQALQQQPEPESYHDNMQGFPDRQGQLFNEASNQQVQPLESSAYPESSKHTPVASQEGWRGLSSVSPPPGSPCPGVGPPSARVLQGSMQSASNYQNSYGNSSSSSSEQVPAAPSLAQASLSEPMAAPQPRPMRKASAGFGDLSPPRKIEHHLGQRLTGSASLPVLR